MTSIESDRALEDPKDDSFSRDQFTQALANALVLPPGAPSIVAGIEAEWGTGKTTVLNFVAHHLKQHESEPIIVRLEGWLLSAGEGTLLRFLGQLVTALGGKDNGPRAKAAAAKLKKYSEVLAPISIIPIVGKKVQAGIDSVVKSSETIAGFIAGDVEGKKQQVVEALRSAGRPIVVILDDLDRLEPHEIRQAFRFVKAVADFERVAYLLAYDPDPVQRALSFDGVYDGKGFLEKIVQLAYPLPRPDYWALKRYLQDRLAPTLEAAKLENFENRRLEVLYSSGGLVRSIRHPRDANRLVNRVTISLLATRNEVNAADVIAFEAIALRFPKVTTAIARRPQTFLSRTYHSEDLLPIEYLESFKERKQKEIPSWRRDLWESLDQPEQTILKSLLTFIFPGFTGDLYSDTIHDSDAEGQLLIRKRWPLLKLLAVGPISSGHSALAAVELLTDVEKRRAALERLFARDTPSGGLHFASAFLTQYPAIDPRGLIELLIEVAVDIPKSEEEDTRSVSELAIFTEEVLKSVGPSANDIFLHIADNSRSLSFSHNLVLTAARGHGLWPLENHPKLEHRITDEATAREGIELWLDRVRERAQSPEGLMKESSVLEILFRWGQFSSFDEVHEFFEQLTSTDDGIDCFLATWPEGSFSLESFLKLVGDWRRFRDRCERHQRRSSLRQEPWRLFDLLEKAEVDSKPEASQVTPNG